MRECREPSKEAEVNAMQMNRRPAGKREVSEEGFTLIELMVVVLIIAILIAIAIPTFLGARTKANDRAAQSSLRNALTSAKVTFTESNDYTLATPAALTANEPSLTFLPAGTDSTSPKTVSLGLMTAEQWTAAALSKSDTCFFIRDDTSNSGGTTFAKVSSSGGACDGGNPPGAGAFSSSGW
jgi:type IV pilus assembly protein PilA